MKNLNKYISLFLLLSFSLLAAQEISLTVTNSNLALVREVRRLDMKKGIQRIDLQDIPQKIDPTSVLIESPGQMFQVLEQNYEYDLVDVSKVLQKSLEKQVRLIHPELGEMSGQLISVSSNHLMLLDDHKQMQIIPRSDKLKIFLPEFNNDEGFVIRPTLVWQVRAAKSVTNQANISYLTRGLTWRADYVARLSEDDKKIDLASWVTVNNTSGKTYRDARLKLMAGELNLVQIRGGHRTEYRGMAKLGVEPKVSEKEFFEYHLYTINRKTTLANNQVKQIQLFPETKTKVQKKFRVSSNDAEKVKVIMEFKNSEQDGLGFALPAGKIRLYKADGDELEFVGEDAIKHTAVDELVKVKAGQAFDIVSERIIKSSTRPSNRSRQQTVEYTIRNHKKSAVTVEVREELNARQQNKLLKASLSLAKRDASAFIFNVALKAKETVKLQIEYVTNW